MNVPDAIQEADDRGWTPDLRGVIPQVDRHILKRAFTGAREESLMQLLARTCGKKRPAVGKCVCGHRNLVLRCGVRLMLGIGAVP
jgi:hypothetical protein